MRDLVSAQNMRCDQPQIMPEELLSVFINCFYFYVESLCSAVLNCQIWSINRLIFSNKALTVEPAVTQITGLQ